jgi:hypothetical protein
MNCSHAGTGTRARGHAPCRPHLRSYSVCLQCRSTTLHQLAHGAMPFMGVGAPISPQPTERLGRPANTSRALPGQVPVRYLTTLPSLPDLRFRARLCLITKCTGGGQSLLDSLSPPRPASPSPPPLTNHNGHLSPEPRQSLVLRALTPLQAVACLSGRTSPNPKNSQHTSSHNIAFWLDSSRRI